MNSKYLKCPYCTTTIKAEIVYSEDLQLWQCQCKKYPYVKRILYLQALDSKSLNECTQAVINGNSYNLIWMLLKNERKKTRYILLLLLWLKQIGFRFSENALLYTFTFLMPEYSQWFQYIKNFKNRRISQIAIKLLLTKLQKNQNILDVGSGPCNLFRLLFTKGIVISKNFYCLDNSFFSLIIGYLLENNFHCTYLCCDASKQLPFSNQTFEKIICLDSLPWIKNKENFIQESSRILKSGGTLLAINIHQKNYPKPIASFGISPMRLQKLLKKNFQVLLVGHQYNKPTIHLMTQEDYSCIAIKK